MEGSPIRTLAYTALAADAGRGGGRLLDGWAEPEDGFVWALGPRSRLALAAGALPRDGTVWLELDVNPFVLPGSVAGQRIHVAVNAVPIGQDRVVGEGTLAYAVPAQALTGGELQVVLDMPDASRPADLGFNDDRRRLGFMVRSVALRHVPASPAMPHRMLPPLHLPDSGAGAVLRAQTGLDPAELLGGFESLGHNCEFGMAQRHCGAEPLGLLRFAGITLPALLRGLEAGFDGVGGAAQTTILVADGKRREFILRDTRHDISLHTLRYEDESSAESVRADGLRHLAFLHRMFADALQTGEKIFVFQRPGQTLLAQAVPLLARLRGHGPNALLFVVQGDAHAPGTVEELGHGFFRGWLGRMAPQDDVGQCDLAAWLSLCANTRRLWSVQTAMQPPR